jgi:hypothetical protein
MEEAENLVFRPFSMRKKIYRGIDFTDFNDYNFNLGYPACLF